MKTILLLLSLTTVANAQTVAPANKPIGTIIFEDDFNRSESQEEKDEPGNGWKTNSRLVECLTLF